MYEINWSAEISGPMCASMTGKSGVTFHTLKEAKEYYDETCLKYKYNPTLKITLIRIIRAVVRSKGY